MSNPASFVTAASIDSGNAFTGSNANESAHTHSGTGLT